MPTWGELLVELAQIAQAQAQAQAQGQALGGPTPPASPHDVLRRKYLSQLHEHTERAVIYYGTAWHETRPISPQTLTVDLGDVRGFMEACSNIEEKKVDLILHSPGGSPDAAESIMSYLRQRFDHIRAVVPLAAMSAATMMALACDEVLMGEHSQLGPIDPQITVATPEGARTAPAQAIKDQFEMAQQDCAKEPTRIAGWMPLLRSLGPGLLSICDTAQQRTVDFVARELEHYMFGGDEQRARAAAEWFGDHSYFKSHGRNVTRDDAREQGVTVVDLEDDATLQDLVLSVSHAAQLTFSGTPCAKLIENHHGRCFLVLEGQQQIVLQAPPVVAPGPVGPQPPSGPIPQV
jgi:hypothetical protein